MNEITPKEIPCPNASGDPPTCATSCDFCGGAGILIVKPKSNVCEVCQNMGNVVASTNGYVGAPCTTCGKIPTQEQLENAIAAMAANLASEEASALAAPMGSSFADDGRAKSDVARLLEPTVKPAYWNA